MLAISSACANRPSGVSASTRSRSSTGRASNSLQPRSDSTLPGAIAFTVIPSRPRAWATLRVSWRTPPFGSFAPPVVSPDILRLPPAGNYSACTVALETSVPMWCPRVLLAPGFVRGSGPVSTCPSRLLDAAEGAAG